MKNAILLLVALSTCTLIQGQINAEIIGKTVTDSIQIIDGAVTGHVLQSVDATGLAEWVHPDSVGDNLGNHKATMTLDMMCNSIDNIGKMSFCPTGSGFSSAMLAVMPSMAGMPPFPDEMIVANAMPGPPAGIALGIGGPVNPPIAPFVASVLGNAGGIVMPPPFYNLGVHGDAWATNWWAVSDQRFKKGIHHFDGALAKISKLEPVQYEMNVEEFPEHNFAEGQTYGFLAQNVKEVAPELVRQRSDGYLLVNYSGVIPILTEGIQELHEKVDSKQIELEKEIEALRLENKDLQQRLAKLESLLMQQGEKQELKATVGRE